MKTQTAIILLLLPLSLFAQQKSRTSFEGHAGFKAAAYDVVWTMPKHMIDLDTTVAFQVRRAYRIGVFCGPILESENQEFILMYNEDMFFRPDLETQMKESTSTDTPPPPINLPRNDIAFILKVAHGYWKNDKFLKIPPWLYKAYELKKPYDYAKKSVAFRFEDYVTLLPKGKARRWFNADTVFIYNMPVDDPFKEGYTHCTDVVITKKDRIGVGLKLYFTDEGKKKEAAYLRSLRKKVWYRNDAWKYDAGIVDRADEMYFFKRETEETEDE